jgi:hypothetical protein
MLALFLQNEDQDLEDWREVGIDIPAPPTLLEIYRQSRKPPASIAPAPASISGGGASMTAVNASAGGMGGSSGSAFGGAGLMYSGSALGPAGSGLGAAASSQATVQAAEEMAKNLRSELQQSNRKAQLASARVMELEKENEHWRRKVFLIMHSISLIRTERWMSAD